MKKIVLCEGDSWTAGDIINPKLDIDYVNHRDNDSYRLPKVWPHKLGEMINKKNLHDTNVINQSVAGSSNDGIVRRTLLKIPRLLEKYKGKEIFVIVGWSSPERKDFFYNDGKRKHWETLYPAQLGQKFHSGYKDLNKFYEIYVDKFWNREEYIQRYTEQNLLLHHYLNHHNIDHMFFDAFYNAPKVVDKKRNSFYNFMMLEPMNANTLWDGQAGKGGHPNEKAHKMWAEEIYNDIKNKV